MPGYMICIDASGVTSPGGNPVGIVALNGRNGDVPLEGVGPAPVYYDHHSIAQETAGYAAVGRPYTNAEWINCRTRQWDLNDSRNRTFLGGPYVGANTPIDFQAFKNGVFTITGFTVTRTGNSGEGAAIHIDLQTLAIPNGFSIYWTLTALTGAARNGFTPSSGSTIVTSTYPGNWPGTAARITLTPDLDNITEGAGSFVMQIHRLGTSGAIFYILPAISVGDTSLYPYFSGAPASINEGASDTFNVAGYDITGPRSPATYYWSVDNAARFGTSSGSFVIANNVGSFSVSPLINLTTNGATTVTVSLRSTSVAGPVIATRTFVINDTSQTPAFTAPTGAVSINEGSAQSFSVSGNTGGVNVTFYWYINHITTVAADFSGGVTNGSFTLNNGGSFSITAIADTLNDGVLSSGSIPARNETFTVSIARTSLGTAVATSPTITINDTSLSPLNPIYWTFSSNPSNSAQTINLNSRVSQGTGVYSGGPYVSGRTGNTFNVVVNSGVVLRGQPGLRVTGGSAAAGDILVVTVNGTVVGSGNGVGGYGTAGGAGTDALDVSSIGMTSLTVNGSGTIAGGGGGGGGATFSQYAAEGGYGAGDNSIAWNTKGSDGSKFGGCYTAGRGGAILSTTNTPYGAGEQGTTVPLGNASGGNQGGGGGRKWCFTGNATGRAQGGRGGVGTGAGGNAPNATTCPGGARIIAFNGGGGGGWGAAGGAGGSHYGLNYGRAGGAGGKSINSGGKTVSSSVANRWGAIG